MVRPDDLDGNTQVLWSVAVVSWRFTRTWVTVQGWVVLAIAACESSGAAALIQAGIWVLTPPSILNTWKNRQVYK